MKKYKFTYCPLCNKLHFLEVREAYEEISGIGRITREYLHCNKTKEEDNDFTPTWMMDSFIWKCQKAQEAIDKWK